MRARTEPAAAPCIDEGMRAAGKSGWEHDLLPAAERTGGDRSGRRSGEPLQVELDAFPAHAHRDCHIGRAGGVQIGSQGR